MIRIRKVGGRFTATVEKGGKTVWTSKHPMSEDELTRELERQGCFRRDIWEAFDEAEGKRAPAAPGRKNGGGTRVGNAHSDPSAAVRIQRTGSEYTATVSNDDRPPWTSPKPLPKDELARILVGRGCHPVDIWDALETADRRWLKDHAKGENDRSGQG
jgi:hypothetical protein